ncbi:uncharacterized protein BDZ83DRAFT_81017 [Colletotrichum acutatum]|uniref:Secreted protein n=1 Tax=Glomerella acutata TaxID=27357 RepID=A0AAD8U914_GLOAC|nr:uncharacterized protein BDZ83DRAFT_81017 [Colletotrichum acutatum]KAK1713390.1 hypothetical protein BDZ83DRAFT_81017 [Colletotrichum acutatum]
MAMARLAAIIVLRLSYPDVHGPCHCTSGNRALSLAFATYAMAVRSGMNLFMEPDMAALYYCTGGRMAHHGVPFDSKL